MMMMMMRMMMMGVTTRSLMTTTTRKTVTALSGRLGGGGGGGMGGMIRRFLFIGSQETPNPNSMMFLPNGVNLLPKGHKTIEFSSIKDAG
jgi:hypothetical protein